RKLSRSAGASRITPCNSVLYHCASASLKSSLSRMWASISPASCVPSPPRSSQAYTPCKANSRARRRALRALLREAPPAAAPRDLLVVKIVFLVVVVVVIIVVRLGLQRCDQIGHFHGCTGAVATLLGSANLGLLFGFRSEHAIGDRNTGLQRDAADSRCAFVANHLEMVGFAADDGAQRDQRVE